MTDGATRLTVSETDSSSVSVFEAETDALTLLLGVRELVLDPE